MELKFLPPSGWPDDSQKVNGDVKPFYPFRNEITCSEGLLFKGRQLINPTKLQAGVLRIIHETHLCVERSKQQVGDNVFRPGLNQQIEDLSVYYLPSCMVKPTT